MQKKEMWRDVSVDDLEEMGRHSDKKRHEICDGAKCGQPLRQRALRSKGGCGLGVAGRSAVLPWQ